MEIAFALIALVAAVPLLILYTIDIVRYGSRNRVRGERS
jgi:hypothetical protein